jgi:3',5'-cyclic AMP phosphodiesterase CpdA
MLLAHVSDPHLNSGPAGAVSAAALDLALRRIAALDPRPDAVVITGDLAHCGRSEEYEILRELLEGFPVPTHLAIGNHDDRDGFLAAFAGSPYLAGGSRTYYAVDYPDSRVIVLDSKDDTTAAGRLGDPQLTWLADQLSERSEVPSFVCFHHPPGPVGIPTLDAIRLVDPEALAAVLEEAPAPVGILVGHVHRAITTTFAGAVVSVAPSTFRQVELDLQPDRPLSFVLEPAGFLLHLTSGERVVSHLVPISHTSAAYGTLG